MTCPVCKGRSTGKIGQNTFYCWDCCVEFRVDEGRVSVFELDEEGTVLPFQESPDETYANPEA
ncbi:MAG: hypothetical protein HYY09_01800 [Firmicutes bacterium]|nr:hypothetical protein [Bacillota bacterium]